MDCTKYDCCSTTGQQTQESYTPMRDALLLADRPIVFSLCEWRNSKPRTWAANVGRLWRTSADIVDQWEGRRPRNGVGILTLADMQAVTLNRADFGVLPEKTFAVRDLWEHKELGQLSGKLTPAHICTARK